MSDDITIVETPGEDVVVETTDQVTAAEVIEVTTSIDAAVPAPIVVDVTESPIVVEVSEVVEIRTVVGGGGGAGASSAVVWDPAGAYGTPDGVTSFASFEDAFAAFMALPPGSDFLIASSGTVPANPNDVAGVWDFQNRARYFGGATAARTPFAVEDGAVIRNATSIGRLSLNLTTSDESRPVFDYTGGRVVTLEDCSVLAIFVTNRPLFLDAGGGINELNIRDTLAFGFLSNPLIVNDDPSPLTTRIEGSTSGLATTDFSGSGGYGLRYIGAAVQTPDAVSADPQDFSLVSGAVTVDRDVPVSSLANDAGYMGSTSWTALALGAVDVVDEVFTGTGEVLRYEYANGVTLYRLVPDPYDGAQDAFYSSFADPNLSGLVASRPVNPIL